MIYGIGCDVVQVERIRDLFNKFGDRFLRRICTASELLRAPNPDNPDVLKSYFAYFAKRFAAKEAYAKALGYGIGSAFSFQDIEIINNEHGQPYINVINQKLPPTYKIHLSISDDYPIVISYVVIEI